MLYIFCRWCKNNQKCNNKNTNNKNTYNQNTNHQNTNKSIFFILQVELKVMQLLGGAEAVPEDILRILKQVKFLEIKIDDFL